MCVCVCVCHGRRSVPLASRAKRRNKQPSNGSEERAMVTIGDRAEQLQGGNRANVDNTVIRAQPCVSVR